MLPDRAAAPWGDRVCLARSRLLGLAADRRRGRSVAEEPSPVRRGGRRGGPPGRLAGGVAARLCRYLQVLTQAKKMGKDRISSQEISEYTNINATQIRRDLSG